MNNLRQLSGLTVLFQAALWVGLLIIFFVVLPGQGFSRLADFNDPGKVGAAPFAMWFIVWSDVLFGVAVLVSVIVLHLQTRTRLPRIIRGVTTIVLLGVVGWFIGHDVGFHILSWPAIERDPASTNYAADRALWAVRNGVFFAVSLLTYFAAVSVKKQKQEDLA